MAARQRILSAPPPMSYHAMNDDPHRDRLTIRRAEQSDCRSIMRVHTSSVLAISTDHYTPEELASWAIPRKMESYEQAIDGKEFYVAAEGGSVLGFAALNRESREIEAVYVCAEAKGRGVGRELLRKLEERGRDLGLAALHLNASLNAVEFYRQAGFVAREKKMYRLASGTEISCVPMVKELKADADAG